MKRISRFFMLILITAFIPLSMALGQEKKKEAKVKVIIGGKDGTETVMDTTFTGDNIPDSIVLDNGKVVRLKKFDDNMTIIPDEKGKGSIYVTTTIKDDDGKKEEEKVIVISGDKGEWTVKPSTGTVSHVYAYADADTDTEMTKYVIAKDGVVVTVESNDEARAKEIIKAIETKLDTKAGTAKQETVKSETKKAGKK